jgi:hypothetical protein
MSILKNILGNVLDSATESEVQLPKWITIVDNANNVGNAQKVSLSEQSGGSTTSQDLMSQLNIKFSATSSNIQKGGNMSATSSGSTKDINKLLSMLTSESSENVGLVSETSTISLENQLREILNQDGGAKKKDQMGGASINQVKNFFMGLKNQGVDVNVKLNNQTMSEFFGSDDTTTDLNSFGQDGGAKKKKKSKKNKKEDDEELEGGVNPGFQAFLDLKKFIAEKLGIANGVEAAKVAGAVQKEMKEKHPNLDAVKIAEEGRKHFEKNIDHYKQMISK